MVKTGPISFVQRWIIELGLLKNSMRWPTIGTEKGPPPKSDARGGASLPPRRGRKKTYQTTKRRPPMAAAHMVVGVCEKEIE